MEAVKVTNAANARELEIAAAVATSSTGGSLPADRTTATDADTTYTANATTATGVSSNKSGNVPKKKATKTKLSAKEKKERSVRTLSCS